MRPISGRTSKTKRALDHTRRVGRGARRGYLATDRAVIGAVRKIVPSKVSQTAVAVMPDRMKYVRHAILPAILLLVVWLVFFNAHAATTGYGGTKTFGAAGDQSSSVVAAAGDDLYVATAFEGSVDFRETFGGTDPHGTVDVSAGAAITKTIEGSYGWTRSLSSNGAVTITDMVATNEHVYVVGYFSGVMGFSAGWSGAPGNLTAEGVSDGFVLKLNTDGSFAWIETYGTAGEGEEDPALVQFNSITMTDEHIAIGGMFSGAVQFDSENEASVITSVAPAGFVFALSDGVAAEYTWSYTLVSDDSAAVNIVEASGDSFIIAADVAGEADVDADPITTDENATGALVVWLDAATGTYDLYYAVGIGDSALITALQPGNDGSLYIGGQSDGTDGFILKLDDQQEDVYARQFAGSGATASVGSILLGETSVYVVGSFTGTINFANSFSSNDSLTSEGDSAGFVSAMTDVVYEDTYLTGATNTDDPKGAVRMLAAASSDPDDLITIVGDYTEGINFAGAFGKSDLHQSEGSRDAFVTTIVTRPLTTLSGGSLRYQDEHGVNLSNPGTQELDLPVTVRDDDDTYLAQLQVNMTESREWSTIAGDTDRDGYRSFLSNILDQPGVEEATAYALYVPRGVGDKAVAICPGVSSLEAITGSCAGRQTYTDGEGADAVTIEGVEYWLITGRSDEKIGGISLAYPGLVITEPAGGWTISEGGTASVGIALRTAPTSDVTITTVSDTPSQATVTASRTFTPTNWSEPQQFAIDAIDDNLVDGPIDVSISVAIASEDELYDEAVEPAWAVQVLDNDTAGIVWSQEEYMTSEGQTVELCLKLTAQPTSPVTLSLSTSDSSEVTIGSLSPISPESWNSDTNCVLANGINDDETDGPSEVTISIVSVESEDAAFSALNSDVGSLPQATVVNQDTDTAGFIFATPQDTRTTEAGGSVEICVTLTARPLSSVTLPLSVDDESEGGLNDDEFVIVPSGWDQNDNCVTVTGVDDKLIDPETMYKVITGSPSSTDPAWDGIAAEEIQDISLTNEDDDVAGLDISSTTVSAAEGSSTTFTVKPDTQPANGNSITLQLVSSDGSQLAASPTSVTFTESDWQTPQTITVTPVDDDLLEGEHSAQISVVVDDELTTETPYRSLSDENIAVAITDNDSASVSLQASQSAEEGGDNGAFTVSLSKVNNTGAPIVVDYEILVSSTAVSGTHYAALPGSVPIAAGSDEATIIVDVSGHNNAVFGGNRTLGLELTGTHTSDVSVGVPGQATVVIVDDEHAEVTLSATDGKEGEDNILLTATLDVANNTGAPLEFTLIGVGGTAQSGADYESFVGATISISDGASAGSYEIIITDDDLLEADRESIAAMLQLEALPAGVTSDEEKATASATIEDDDTATITITASDASEPTTAGSFTVSLSKVNNTGDPIAVTFTPGGSATSGTDYTALPASATIANGASTSTVTVTPIDDKDIEGDESVVATLTGTDFDRTSIGDPGEAALIIGDDEEVRVNVTTPDDTTSEDGGTAQVCFTLASRPSSNVAIALSSSDETKVSVPSNILIERDDWNEPQCITAAGHDDTPPAVTGPQSITIYTGDITTNDPFYAALTAEDIDDAVLTHQDNDQPGITVQAVDSVTSEDGSKQAHVRFRLTTEPSHAVTIPLSISDATEGSLQGVEAVTIDVDDWDDLAANEIIIYGVDDDLTDGDIVYQLVTGDVTSADPAYEALTANDVEDTTLSNEDDDEAAVTVETIREGAVEGGTTAAHDVTIGSQPAEDKQVVIIATPADNQIDLGTGAGQPQQLIFTHENWDEAQRITITAVDDTDLEADHASSVIYSIAGMTDEQAYNEYEDELPTISVPIEDNDTAEAILTAEDGSETGPGHLVFRVTLDNENKTGAPITFMLNGTGGSATPETDYATIEDVVISIPSGVAAGEAQIGIVDDALLEGDETVTAVIGSASLPAVTITGATASATIVDDDSAELSIIATTPTAQESPASSGEFTVQLSRVNNTGAPITVQYSVTGSASPDEDYESLGGTTAIAVGQSSTTIAVDTDGFDDEVVEGNETVVVTLTESDHPLVSVGGSDVATVTIIDDDTFAWSVITEENGAEEGAEPVVFRVRLSKLNTTGAPMTITLADPETGTAAKGEDYDAFDGVVTIPAGEQEATVEVTVIDDEKLERAETIGALLQNPSQGDIGVANATATITDNDSAELSVTATVDETVEGSDDPARFTLSLDKTNDATTAILIQYTVNGTAVGGQDYALLSGTANIAPGQDQTYVNIATAEYNNDVYAGDKTVQLTLASTNHSGVTISDTPTATVTIKDDETAPVDPDPDPDPEPTEPSQPGAPQTPGDNGGGVIIVRPSVPSAPAAQTSDATDNVPDPLPQPVDQTKKDLDSDGIDDAVEAKAFNKGDGNGDGIPDNMQKNVASLVSSVTSKPVTLAVTGECSTIKRFKVVGENELDKADRAYRYPHGLVDYEVSCPGVGKTADVAVYYDESFGDSYTWRKLMAPSLSFAALEDAQLVQRPVGKAVVTAVAYSITDGDVNDDDGKRDGKIIDPAGLATHVLRPLDILWLTPVFVLAAALIARGIVVHRRHHRAAQRISRW